MLSRVVSPAALFFGIFVVSFYMQHSLWEMRNTIVDDWIWGHAITHASDNLFFQPVTRDEVVRGAYGYPGATLIIPSALLVRAGLTSLESMRYVISLSIAFWIAAVAWICFRLRPRSFWWAGVTLLLLFNDLYFIATPPSSMVMVCIAFITLCVLYIFEHIGELKNNDVFTAMGFASGFALATRFDITLCFCLSALVFLTVVLQRVPWVYVGTCALSLLIFDPYIVAAPILHFSAFVSRVFYVQQVSAISVESGVSYGSSAFVIFESAPPAILAFIITLVLVRWPKIMPFSKMVMLWLVATTVFIFSVLFYLPTHPQWYFFPLFIVWEVFLPLCIWAPFQAMTNISQVSRSLYPAILFGGIVSAQLYLLANIMLS